MSFYIRNSLIFMSLQTICHDLMYNLYIILMFYVITKFICQNLSFYVTKFNICHELYIVINFQ